MIAFPYFSRVSQHAVFIMVLTLQDSIRMVLDFLQSQSYFKALIALEQESQVRLYSYGKEIDFFYDLLSEGKFDDVEKLIETVKERSLEAHDAILGLLRKQKFLELLESANMPVADELAQILKDIEALMPPEEYETLFSILSYDHLTDHPKFANWTIWRGRYECFKGCYSCLADLYAIESPAPVPVTLAEVLTGFDGEISAETGSSSRLLLLRGPEGSGSSVVVNDSGEIDTVKRPLKPQFLIQSSREARKKVLVETIDPSSGSSASKGSDDPVLRHSAHQLMLNFDPGTVYEVARIADQQAIRACGFDPSGDYCGFGWNGSSLKIVSIQGIVTGVLYEERKKGKRMDVEVLMEARRLHSGTIYCMDWSARGLQIVTGSNDKTIKIVTVPDLERVLNEQNSSLLFEDGVDLDGENDLQLRTITDLPGTVRTLCFHPLDDELFFSSGSGTGEIMVWNTQTTQCVQRFAGHQGGTIALATAGDASFIQSVGSDGMIRLWDLRTHRCVQVVNAESYGQMTSISLNCSAAITRAETKAHIANLYSGSAERGRKNCQKLASVSHVNGLVTLWDVSSGRIFSKFPIHKDNCRSVEFSSDKRWLATASFDQTIGLINLETNTSYRLSEHQGKAVTAHWHPYLPILLSTSTDRTARLFSI